MHGPKSYSAKKTWSLPAVAYRASCCARCTAHVAHRQSMCEYPQCDGLPLLSHARIHSHQLNGHSRHARTAALLLLLGWKGVRARCVLFVCAGHVPWLRAQCLAVALTCAAASTSSDCAASHPWKPAQSRSRGELAPVSTESTQSTVLPCLSTQGPYYPA